MYYTLYRQATWITAMGKYFKSGQYGDEFTRKATPVVGKATTPWREAAKDEIKRLIGSRGGSVKLDVPDSRDNWKKVKQFELMPVYTNKEKVGKLEQLYGLIDNGNSIGEIQSKAEGLARTSKGETKKLAQALFDFVDAGNCPNNEQAVRLQKQKEQPIDTSAQNGDARFAIVTREESRLERTTANVQLAHKSGDLEPVPSFSTDKPAGHIVPFATLSVYYSQERQGRHNKLQTALAILYAIGAACINSEPKLLSRYHGIMPQGQKFTEIGANTQAFFVMGCGLLSLPEDMATAGFRGFDQDSRFTTMGTQNLKLPNGGILNDMHALEALSSLPKGIFPRCLHLSEGFALPMRSDVPGIDLSSHDAIGIVQALQQLGSPPSAAIKYELHKIEGAEAPSAPSDDFALQTKH